MKTIIEMAREAGFNRTGRMVAYFALPEEIERFAALVRADERDRNTQLLYKMHERAAAQHNYYKHAAIEINRKAGEGEKI